MAKRFISIWFPHLLTDWFLIRKPALKTTPFVLTTIVRGKKIITSANTIAAGAGITAGMSVADARAIVMSLIVLDDIPGHELRLLTAIARWCIRYTPVAAVDPPNGIILDISGCTHLWGGEKKYIDDIVKRLHTKGYSVRAGMADTAGAAWGIARFEKEKMIAEEGAQLNALLPLPPAALRLDMPVLEKLQKLGLLSIAHFIRMPRSALLRRFGKQLLDRIDEATGRKEEPLTPVILPALYEERLHALEPVCTRVAIDIALEKLLLSLCTRLQKAGKGARSLVFRGYRVDGKTEEISIGTNHPSYNVKHLLKLFEISIARIEPALGIELFTLEATVAENVNPEQEVLWTSAKGLQDKAITELLDRVAIKIGQHSIRRYLPDEHYWPERSVKLSSSLQEQPSTSWRIDKPRPVQLLPVPERIDVTAPIPDYPPMLFRHKGILHTIRKADGPERIEREWWLEDGAHRDYYHVEDEEGRRYWLFRLGHYDERKTDGWYLHGMFA